MRSGAELRLSLISISVGMAGEWMLLALLWTGTWAKVLWHRRVDGHSSDLGFRITHKTEVIE